MIPLRLTLHNFLSYRDCTLDFTRLRVAAVSGANGHGKSALLDALTWSLWGRCRAATDDDAILLGAGEMLVDLEFEVDGDRFAVNRKKTRGKTAQLHLFHVEADGSRVPMTGSTMRDTQGDINHRLRLDYETFRNSVFIAQGHADEFTRKTPAERKAVLRSVLGLERYEEYAGQARDFAKERDAELRTIRARLGEALDALDQLPAVSHRLAELAAEEAALVPTVAAADERVASLRLAAAEFARREADVAATRTARQRAEERLAARRSTAARAQADLEHLQTLLVEGAPIRERHATLLALRAEEAALAAAYREVQEARNAAGAAAIAIARAAADLEASARTIRNELAGAEAAEATLSGTEERAAALGKERAALDALKDREDAARAEAGSRKEAAASAAAAGEAARDTAQAIKDREAQLEGVAICPVCRSPLDPGDVEHVRTAYAAERRALGERYREARARETANVEAAAACEAEAARLRGEREQREVALHAAEREVHAARTAALAQVAALPALRDRLRSIEDALRDESFEPEARAIARSADGRIAAAGYDAARHETVLGGLAALADTEEQFRALETAAGRAADAMRARDDAAERAEEAASELQEADEALAAALRAWTEATDVAGDLKEALATQSRLADRSRHVVFERGQAENEQARLLELKARVEAEKDRETALAAESSLYGELARAFGRDGVQAMLIDQALPRTEVIANDLLARMTGGRIQLQLATRKETRGGRVAETLDIRISDELGQRDYEMFSGGEAFRIDFALRIALSRLLAERSGASLATLIIDEGFGTQDQEGLDRLVDALMSIRDEFRLVLVVTHIEEMKARFESRIEVWKDPVGGSFALIR